MLKVWGREEPCCFNLCHLHCYFGCHRKGDSNVFAFHLTKTFQPLNESICQAYNAEHYCRVNLRHNSAQIRIRFNRLAVAIVFRQNGNDAIPEIPGFIWKWTMFGHFTCINSLSAFACPAIVPRYMRVNPQVTLENLLCELSQLTGAAHTRMGFLSHHK